MTVSELRNNKDKLLLAAIDLMDEKGYKGVSTKDIAAAAGVSEMTLFRNFGSKQNLLETAVNRFYYSGDIHTIFDDKLVYELHEDLLLISSSYHEMMNRNRKLILIVQQAAELSSLRAEAQKHPRQLQEKLTAYFTSMMEKGKLIPTNPEAQAITFMWMNYGAFTTHLHGAESITSVTMQEFMESSVQLFVKALTP